MNLRHISNIHTVHQLKIKEGYTCFDGVNVIKMFRKKWIGFIKEAQNLVERIFVT